MSQKVITNINSGNNINRVSNTATNNYTKYKSGHIDYESIDLNRIADSQLNANDENFLNQNSLYKDIWKNSDDLTFEVLDGNSVIIKNHGIGIGYTDIKGINTIIDSNIGKNISNYNGLYRGSITNSNSSYNGGGSTTNYNYSSNNMGAYDSGSYHYSNVNTSGLNYSNQNINNHVVNLKNSYKPREYREPFTDFNNSKIITDLNMVSNEISNKYNGFVNIDKDDYNILNIGEGWDDFYNRMRSNKVYEASNPSLYADKCLSFAYYHAHSYYTGDYTGYASAANNYDRASHFKSYSNDSKEVILKRVYEELSKNKPVILHVSGTSMTSRHYVTVIGVKKAADPANLQETDFIQFDSYQGDVTAVGTRRKMITGAACHKPDYTGYQIYYLAD